MAKRFSTDFAAGPKRAAAGTSLLAETAYPPFGEAVSVSLTRVDGPLVRCKGGSRGTGIDPVADPVTAPLSASDRAVDRMHRHQTSVSTAPNASTNGPAGPRTGTPAPLRRGRSPRMEGSGHRIRGTRPVVPQAVRERVGSPVKPVGRVSQPRGRTAPVGTDGRAAGR